MTIQLDHVIVPSRQPIASARLLAGLLGVSWEASRGEFSPVYINDSLTVDFMERDQFQRYHLCFRVGEEDFDVILGRIQSAGLKYRSMPRGETDMIINRRLGGKNLYWEDSDGHLWEILTVSYARSDSPSPAVAR
jgi:catechol 2,3-dioxygenase-like lactoylglutathione lyase family enzyme